VKLLLRKTEGIVFQELAIGGNNSVFPQPIQGTISAWTQTNIVTFRLFQEEAGKGKNRVRERVRFDLANNTFQDARMRQTASGDRVFHASGDPVHAAALGPVHLHTARSSPAREIP